MTDLQKVEVPNTNNKKASFAIFNYFQEIKNLIPNVFSKMISNPEIEDDLDPDESCKIIAVL